MFVLLSILVLGLLIVVHELGHFLAARWQHIRVSRFSIGFGPVVARYQGPEVEYALRALPLGGYVGFPDDDPDSGIPKDDPNLLKNRPILDRTIVLLAGVTANFVFGYLVLLALVVLGGVPETQVQPGALIQQVTAGQAAERAGLEAGDVVLEAAGRPIGSGDGALAQLSRVFQANPDKPVNLVIRRGEQRRPVALTPSTQGKVGVSLSPNGTVTRRAPRDIAEVFTSSATAYGRIAVATLNGFGQLFTGRAGIDQLTGPVGIVAVTAQAAQSDWLNLFYVAALISFNLAVLNLLPLPALDGGQLVFVIAEALRGKPVPDKIQNYVNQAGMLVLLGLGILLIFRDTFNLLQ
ncbi:MAG: RIP metalloprotease RseP [Aphanocapsa lilacina HA4352-LM1]|jgi:membrane-associated protease RseP (regulator of RpoE activity)|nr:RIP metalloprotease RseP [Aphanocapsa lilacina HA4352-LM1]